MRTGHVISALAALALGAGALIAATPASADPLPGGAVDCDFAVAHMGNYSGWTITCYQGPFRGWVACPNPHGVPGTYKRYGPPTNVGSSSTIYCDANQQLGDVGGVMA